MIHSFRRLRMYNAGVKNMPSRAFRGAVVPRASFLVLGSSFLSWDGWVSGWMGVDCGPRHALRVRLHQLHGGRFWVADDAWGL